METKFCIILRLSKDKFVISNSIALLARHIEGQKNMSQVLVGRHYF